MQYKIDLVGLVIDGDGYRIGPAVDRYKIVGTDRMDGWDGVTVRLWSTIMTSNRDQLTAIDAKHNVQFRIEASTAKALAHAILDEIGQSEALS